MAQKTEEFAHYKDLDWFTPVCFVVYNKIAVLIISLCISVLLAVVEINKHKSDLQEAALL